MRLTHQLDHLATMVSELRLLAALIEGTPSSDERDRALHLLRNWMRAAAVVALPEARPRSLFDERMDKLRADLRALDE